MHIREILVIWPKYTHRHTHTQTRTTHANTYPSTWLSHLHLSKHKKTTQTHQQAQTRPRGHTQCGQQPHKNTKKHQHRHDHMCVCVKGFMCTHMVQEWAQGYHGTERSKKRATWCIEEDRGGFYRARMAKTGCKKKMQQHK